MRRLKQTWIAAALGMSVWMTACAGAASETATQEGVVDEESQGAIREAVAENDRAQEQPKRDKTQEIGDFRGELNSVITDNIKIRNRYD